MKDYKETVLEYYQKLLEDIPMLDGGRVYNRFTKEIFDTEPRLRKTFDIDLNFVNNKTSIIVNFLSETENLDEEFTQWEKRSGFKFYLSLNKEDQLQDFSVFKKNLTNFEIPLKLESMAVSDNDHLNSYGKTIQEKELGNMLIDFNNIIKEVIKELPDREVYLDANKNYGLIDDFFGKYGLN